MERIRLYCYLLLLGGFLWGQHSVAQDWAWANYVPWSFNVPTSNTPVYIEVQAKAITHDAGGNAYVTGYIDVEDGDNGDDASIFFVAKFNAAGQLDWLRQYGQPFGPEAHGEDIIADNNGNVYVTGAFYGTLSFGNTLSLTSTNSDDIFIVKYNTQGTVQWASKAGGNSNDRGKGIALDNQGNVVITGYIRGAASFGNSVFTFDNSPNSSDYFVAKYHSLTGDAIWVKRSNSTDYKGAWGTRINTDHLGYLWSIGHFKHNMTLDNVTLSATPNINQPGDDYDIFVSKHDAAGNLLWVKSFGGNNLERPGDIVCDLQGNGYITGSFYGNISFDNILLTTFSSKDGFIAKMNSVGNIIWAKGISGSQYDEARGVGTDANGNCYVAGATGNKLIVNKYKPNGDLDWTREATKHYTVNWGGIWGTDISTDGDGNSYVAGMFDSELISFENFNVSGTHGDQSGYSIQQGLAAKLSATDLFFPPEIDPGVWEEWPIKPGPDPVSQLKAFPNPSDDVITLQFRNPSRDIGYLGIYNEKGKLIHLQEFRGDMEQRISFRVYGRGYFYARLVMGEEVHTQTLIIE